MSFADHYLRKQQKALHIPFEKPSRKLKYCIVIPCYNEDRLLVSLDSIWNCQRPESEIEVVIVVNSSETDTTDVINQNLKTIDEFEIWKQAHIDPAIKLHLVHIRGIPKKHAGAGMARKTGMDFAVRRFNAIDQKDGIIISFDADCTCDENYLYEIESGFTRNDRADCAILYFEHPVQGDDFPPEIYSGIVQYELHLRYHIGFLRFIRFPYAYHTLGSCFAVKADAYIKQGGMNRRKAGEDFYFLQKIFTSGKTVEINQTRICPSPRPSLRVPFGTGPVIHKMFSGSHSILETYNPQAYLDLGRFFQIMPQLYRIKQSTLNSLLRELPDSIKEFLVTRNVDKKLDEVNRNTANHRSFVKRIYNWFNGFMVVKYLNATHQKYYTELPVAKAAGTLLQNSGVKSGDGKGALELLHIYREIQRDQHYAIPL